MYLAVIVVSCVFSCYLLFWVIIGGIGNSSLYLFKEGVFYLMDIFSFMVGCIGFYVVIVFCIVIIIGCIGDFFFDFDFFGYFIGNFF